MIFYLYPALDSFRMSLYDYKLVGGDFIGFSNYASLFKDSQFLKSLLNTFWFVIYVVPATIVFSLIIAALIVNKGEFLKSFIRGAFYLPAVVSFVALSMVWSWIFNPVLGLSQYVTKLFGLGVIEFFGHQSSAIAALSLIIFTTAIGQCIVLYTAALGGIPASYYEAAELDGASKIKQFFNITLSLIKPTTLFLTIIVTINTFQVFVVVQLLTSGGPDNGTSTILFQLFRTAFEYNNFGLASTMGIVMFVIILVISVIQYKFLSSDIEY
jgi:ABC-type sugar transport systems, permease components